MTEANEPGDPGYLYMNRFCGLEKYRIDSATWNLHDYEGRPNLCIYLGSKEAIQQAEDTAELFQRLNWELNIVEDSVSEAALKPGFECNRPNAYEESQGGWITNFYFVSHEGTHTNRVRILEAKGDELLIELSGKVLDVNFYDGSKPDSTLSAVAWFSKRPSQLRSFA